MKLDPLLTERARLLIMATVAASEGCIEFVSLLEITGLSKGNLSTHARKLEEAGYLAVEKKFVGRKPVTQYLCTESGKSAMREHLQEIERMLKEVS
jgi:DNA-binding MarR family transcriptional regulator